MMDGTEIHFIFSENCTSPCSVLIMNLCKLTMHPDENKEMKKWNEYCRKKMTP